MPPEHPASATQTSADINLSGPEDDCIPRLIPNGSGDMFRVIEMIAERAGVSVEVAIHASRAPGRWVVGDYAPITSRI